MWRWKKEIVVQIIVVGSGGGGGRWLVCFVHRGNVVVVMFEFNLVLVLVCVHSSLFPCVKLEHIHGGPVSEATFFKSNLYSRCNQET